MKHIDKGCPSGIQPGCGTNRNECLHKQLNAILSNSRYGVGLAYALVTSTFHIHNEEVAAKREKRTARPITACVDTTSSLKKCFGLSNIISSDDNSVVQVATEPKIPIVQLDWKTVQEQLANLESTLGSECSEVESEYDFTVEFSPAEALLVLQQATCSFYVAKSLEGILDTAYINSKDVFFISFIAAIEGLPTEATSHSPAAQLESVLSSWNLKRIPVPEDGNCLFTALLQRLQSKNENVAERLSALGLPMEKMHDINTIAELLRHCMVNEWIDNTEYYQGFVTTDITAVVYQYQTSGQFTGDLGDLMVLTLANVLHMPITIFTSVVNMPVVCITPTMQVADSAQPLFLTFIQEGPGHYDYAVTGQSTTASGQHKTDTGNKNHEDVHVVERSALVQRHVLQVDVHVPEQKSNVTPFVDVRIVHVHMAFIHHPQQPRRALYDTQRQPLCGHPTDLFMQRRGESSVHGHLTLLEVMVLKALAVYFIVHGLAITTDNNTICISASLKSSTTY